MSDANLASSAPRRVAAPAPVVVGGSRWRADAEYVVIPLIAIVAALLLFALFLIAVGKSPIEFVELVWRGGFGTSFSLQNTLQRSSPLILTALAVAIPARIGLIMIGGEGALVLGGFLAAAIAIPLVGHVPPLLTLPLMALAAMIAGGFWVGFAAISATRAASTKRSRRCC